MNTTHYDSVVIGGGFAGLACAQVMSRKGLQVKVLEKKPWPGTKSHTTGIVVKELAESWDIPARLSKKISAVRIYSPNMESLDLYSPEYYFLATDTPALLRWHAEQAIQAGTSISYSYQYRHSTSLGGYHHLNDGDIRCRYLIGSDGSRSRVARQYSLGRNRCFLFGIEADFHPIPNLSQDHLHVFLDNDITSGYIAWVVPGVHTNQVGLASRSPSVPALERFLHKIASTWNIDKSAILSIRSGLIPCGGIVKPFHGNDVLLLGDAAGMVSPLTAGGIHPAVNIGTLAGELVAEYLLYHQQNPGRALRRELPHYLFKRNLRSIYDKLPFSNSLFNALIHTPLFRTVAQAVFFHHRGFLSTAAWRDIVRMSLHS